MLTKNHVEIYPPFALGENEGKYAFFMFFHEFENFFERVFALNNFFSFSKKIMFWGEHLKKKLVRSSFFNFTVNSGQKRLRF